MPFSDIRMETSLVIEEGATVVGGWVFWATHAATGKTVQLPGVSVCELRTESSQFGTTTSTTSP
jgi:hypothetical protein